MTFLSNADAIIIYLRNNGGGTFSAAEEFYYDLQSLKELACKQCAIP